MNPFLPEPIFPALHLDAALRDLRAKSARARANAARALPDALALAAGDDPDSACHELGYERLAGHGAHARALSGLRPLQRDEDGLVRGLSFIARGMLGDATLLNDVVRTLGDGPVVHPDPSRGTDMSDVGDMGATDGEADAWVLECRIISLAELARFCPPPPGLEQDAVLRGILLALRSGAPQARFQAMAALADAAPSIARDISGDQLAAESDSIVRAQILDVCRELGQAPASVLKAARACVRGENETVADASREAFAAARLLASVGDSTGEAILRAALPDPDLRDDALEALAVLPASRIPTAAVDAAERLFRRRLIPSVTRVRAAYLMARADPTRGVPALEGLRRSLRPRVRAAATEAMALLEALDARDAASKPKA